MKANRQLFYLLTALCLMGAASCQKSYTGRTIRVHSRTCQNTPFTKTAFNGETYDAGSDVYERIDWSSGDVIAIAMKNDGTSFARHEYEINDISAKGRFSEAGLEPDGGNGLTWGSGTHDFWGVYPSTATLGDHTASAAIPAAQTATFQRKKNDVYYYAPDMSNAFMVASQQATPSSAGIDLDFYPAFTTFDFTVGTNDDIVIKGFEMETTTSGLSSNVALSGTVTATFDPANNMGYTLASSGTGRSIAVSFLDGNGNATTPSLSQSTLINFKVLAVPQDITGVRIRFTVATSSGDVTHSLRLKENDTWYTFPGGVKTNITGLLIPGAVWYIKFGYPREEQWIINPDIEVGVE